MAVQLSSRSSSSRMANNETYEWQRKKLNNNNNHSNDKSQHRRKTNAKRKRIRDSRHLQNKMKMKIKTPSSAEVAGMEESLYHSKLSDGRLETLVSQGLYGMLSYVVSTAAPRTMAMMATTTTASSFLTALLMNSTTLAANKSAMAANVLTAIANLGTILLDDVNNTNIAINSSSSSNSSVSSSGRGSSIMSRYRWERQVDSTAYTGLSRVNNVSFVEAVTAAAINVANLSLAAASNFSIFSSSSSNGGSVPTNVASTAAYDIDKAATMNGDISFNDSDDMLAEDASEYIFDRTDVRIIFITLYTLVFCCCFFGNLLVILVVTLSRRLRSITNFFLANLALADFCVGLFCVMQNLSIYLIDSWVFGEFLCRMYQFVHSLSYTASIFILVVICMERYFAIVHPITCKQILTAARLRMVMLTVWITSAVYSTPKFVFSKTIKNIHNEDGQEEEICVLDRKMFNSKLLDMINFVLLYVIPLLVMTVLYSKIAVALWRSSRGLSHQIAQQQQQDNNSMNMHNSMYHHHQHLQHHHQHHQHHHQQAQQHQNPNQQVQQQGQLQPPSTPILMAQANSGPLSRKQSSKYEKRGVSISESQVSLESERPIVSACRKTSFYNHTHQHQLHGQHPQQHHRFASSPRGAAAHISHSSTNVLRARRGVVRMLIIFVLTFALCNLPYHARKMWQYWSRSYRGDTNFNALLTPLTFLVTYFNSGVNPLLYAFLSRNFRKGMKELLMCSWKKGKGKSSSNSSMHHKRVAVQTHSLPTDTTHIGNEQV